MMEINEIKDRLADEGYCILENLISPEEAQRLDSLVRPMMDPMGNDYISLEGSLNHFPELAQLCIHPLILDIAESVLGEGFIIANNVAMKWCKPGNPQHGLHADWPTSGALRTGPGSPIPPWNGLQVFWMLTDGTPENGATRIVPFSHHTQRAPSRESYPQEIPVTGKKGSAFVYHNGLWHRTGANTTTDQHRMFANIYYMPMWVYRPPSTWPLVKRKIYDSFPPRLQELLVHSVEPD